jgi:hypothetical protein
MRNWLVVFALATSMMHAQAGAQQTEPGAEKLPGHLDSFLKATPNASLTTKALGSLAGFQDGPMDPESGVSRRHDVTATFTAMAASSPADSSLKAKGIEVRFEFSDEHENKELLQVVYVDEDALLPFQYYLGELGEIQTFALTHLQNFPDPFPACGEVPAFEPVSGAEEIPQHKERGASKASVLMAGLYRKADETSIGVGESAVCFHAPGVAAFFPNTTLEQLIGIVAEGHAFLAAN